MPDPTAIPPCSACSEPIPDPAERWPATNAYALPTVHLNGTGAKSLADEYHAVYQAIDKASDALQAATCNGRDCRLAAGQRRAG
jgi:hypothetical protein